MHRDPILIVGADLRYSHSHQCKFSSEHNTTIIAITSKEKTTNKDDSFPADTNESEVVDMDESVILEDNPKTDTVKQDPALWPLHFTDAERSKYCEKDSTFFQNKNSDFKNSVRKCKNQNRFFNPKHFTRALNNGEKCERKWLLYSESTGNVLCYTCKLFGVDHENSFVTGFSNWKKTNLSISGENRY
ncbi:zinc finger MYM-type protein 5-like [Nasonia vitripennis]|uniref:TTF-type domain-containing protein n=1 Tax=Nasonia vitripennis TaxID=7425 RepID=A0A7M7T9M1_NASVI|nr:zinc finger MYM-type protein 5-like [Nasonia vitripennis]